MTVLEVDGVKITQAEFEQKRPGSIFQARNAFFDAERTTVRSTITSMNTWQTGKTKGENLTAAQMVEKHVMSVIPPDPSDDALRVYYEGIDTQAPFEAVRAQILDISGRSASRRPRPLM